MSILTRLAPVFALLLSATPLLAAEGEIGHDQLPAGAEPIFQIGFFTITNSMVMVWLVAAFLIILAQVATRKITIVPSGLQNFMEWVVESLINFLGGIMGDRLARRTFWFFATIFILILASNWAGLFPGVGTVGWLLSGEGVQDHDTFRPFLRGANADLNLTAAMSLTFFVLWFYWAITEIGFKNFGAHLFAPKGDFKGIMLVAMVLIFFAVGLLEMVSIAFRPVALMFRLYGNIYAGETMLESIMNTVPVPWLKWLAVVPFLFLELLVGFIQALVFTLLCAVFLKLITDHGHDEDHGEHAKHDEPGHLKTADPAR